MVAMVTMKELYTDGHLIQITTFDKQTSKPLDELVSIYQPFVIYSGNTKKYFLYVADTTEEDWTTPDRTMGQTYNGFFGFYGDVSIMPPIMPPNNNSRFEIYSGDIKHIIPIPKSFVDLLITKFCDLIVETYNNKSIKTIEKSPLEQLELDVDVEFTEISIPSIIKRWDSEEITRLKINSLNNNPNPILEYGVVTYSGRYGVLSSVFTRLIRLGYSESDIRDICVENNLVMGRFDYNFTRFYENAMVYIINHNVTQSVHKLYNIQFKYWNDSLVYRALLSLALQNFTMSPSVTNMTLRKLTGISHQQSITESLNRLVSMGRIIKTFSETITNDSGHYYDLYNFKISSELVPENIGNKFDCLSALLLHQSNLLPIKTFFISTTEELNAQKAIGKAYLILPLLYDDSFSSTIIADSLMSHSKIVLKQLKYLLELGLIIKIKNGRNVTYKLTDDHHEILQELMVTQLLKSTSRISKELERYVNMQETNTRFNITRDAYLEGNGLKERLQELGNSKVRK